MPAYTNSTAIGRDQIAGVIQGGVGLNSQLIYKDVLPPFGVNRRTAQMITASIAATNSQRILSDPFIRQPGAVFERYNMTFGESTFTVAQRGWEVVIPDEVEMDLSAYFSVEAMAAANAVDAIELTNEYLTGAAMQSTSNFGAGTAAIVNYTAANLATINFPQDVLLAIERVRNKGEMVNTIIVPELVMNLVMQATLTRNFVYQQTGFSPMAGAAVTAEVLQKAFQPWGIEKVLVGRARYNVATDQNTTLSFTKCWLTDYITVCKTGSSFLGSDNGISTVQGVGATVFWEKLTPGMVYGVETYRAEDRKSNVVRTLTTAQPFIANTNTATLITTNYA
jgi:hypothetical protein